VTRAILLRLGHAVLSVFFLLTLVFCLVRLTGDPINFLLPAEASPEQKQMLRERLGLDQPLPVQFVAYIGQLAQGDLGISFRSRVPVPELILQRMPATLTMGAAAVVLTLVIAVPLAIYAAHRRGGWLDRGARGFAAVGQAVPDFWVGFLLILVFAVWLRALPAGGFGSPAHLILPAITLAVGATAGLIRLLRSSMIEVLASDHVLFRRTTGLPENRILWRYALRNAGLTALSFIGIIVAGLFTGSVLVETIFVWPGMGRLFIESIQNRDYAVIQGVMLLFAGAYIVVNLLVDVAYMLLDPRLR
jgi:peptide/nickel transport system permease protein